MTYEKKKKKASNIYHTFSDMMNKYGNLKANITRWRRTLETEVEEHENEIGSDFRAAVSISLLHDEHTAQRFLSFSTLKSFTLQLIKKETM